MARMALTVAGAAIGTVIAPGIGTQIGALAGNVVGGLLFPPKTPQPPKPDDTSVAPGTYGDPIAIAAGISDIGCDLIWVRGNKKDIKKKTQSVGGKGLGGPTSTTWEYFATFALQICDGPITGLRKLHFGKELVYDATEESLDAAITSGDPLPLTGALEGVTFRLYTGTPDQAPDPAIQAEDAFAPAWRGRSYMVFEDMPLEKVGNGIPGDAVPASAEVTEGPATQLKHGLASAGTTSGESVAYDPARQRMFVSDPGDVAVRVYDVARGTLERVDDLTGVENVWKSSDYGSLSAQPDAVAEDPGEMFYNDTSVAIAPDGSFYVLAERQRGQAGDTFLPFASGLVVDAETGQWLATMSSDAAANPGTANGYAMGESILGRAITDHKLREVDWLPPDPLTGLRRFLYLRAQNHEGAFFGAIGLGDRGAVATEGVIRLSEIDGNGAQTKADVDTAGNTVFALYAASGDVRLARVPIGGVRGAATRTEFWDTAYEPDLIVTVSGVVTSAISELLYDREHEHVVCRFGATLVIFDAALNEVTRGSLSDVQLGGHWFRNDPAPGEIWFGPGTDEPEMRALSTEDATEVGAYAYADWDIDFETDTVPLWKAGVNSWVGYALGTGGTGAYQQRPFLLFRDRFGLDKIPLASVLQAMAERAGLDAAKLDLSACTRLIYGAPQKGADVTARSRYEDLLQQTGHYAVMSGGKIAVRPLATGASGTLDETVLGADGKAPIRRESDSSQPARRLQLRYKSVEANMEPATQAYEFPREVVAQGRTVNLETTLRMDDDEAWESVERLVTLAAAERTELEVHVPYTEDVEPGQIWTLSAEGRLIDMRVGEVDGGAVKTVRGRAAWPFISPSGTPVDSSRPPETLAEISVTDYELVDSHMWRDPDDDGGLYAVAWPRRQEAQWDGGVILRSPTSLSGYSDWLLMTAAATVGQATGGLGDVPSANSWDRLNTLTVRMLSGAPESATEAEVLDGANPVWVAAAGGEWELIQFAAATENADGSWSLSTLLRGRRGTEHLTGLHASGDRVVWAGTATARRGGGDNIGGEMAYASASIGSTRGATTRRNFTNRARSLRPYAPASVSSSRDGSGNITGVVTRRSRIHGDPSYTGVPLGEDSEDYEIDVLDEPGGAVLRTIGVTGTDTFGYPAADQTADFGSAQSAVPVAIHQMSASVGRGVALEATI